jgi:sugar phosphate isomerase/epimerase
MRIAVSNIAWAPEHDLEAASLLRRLGVEGLEVAPTKAWPRPLESTLQQRLAFRRTWEAQGLPVVAMQALLFGQAELSIFGPPPLRQRTIEYLQGMIGLAADLGARVLVFGSPKNRRAAGMPAETARQQACEVFRALGETALARGCIFCIEANPPEYDCDFVTRVDEAFSLVQSVNHPGFGLHLDAGGLLLSGEHLAGAVAGCSGRVEHFHASEPFLAPIGSSQHQVLAASLGAGGYGNWVSLEMRTPTEQPLATLETSVERVRSAYGRVGQSLAAA